MGTIAGILGVLGVVGIIYAVMQKMKAGRIANAPFVKTGDAAMKGKTVANDKGAISAQGQVECDAPLVSPVTKTPCLYYEMKIVGEWKSGDSKKTKDYVDEKEAAQFAINDGSGPVKIMAAEGGDFDMENSFDETKKEGLLAGLKSAVGKGQAMQFGEYEFHNPAGSKADKFTCTEKVLKVDPELYVCGKTTDDAIGSPSWTSLIISNKGRDALLGSATKGARNFFIGGGAALVVAAILGIVSSFTGGGEVNANEKVAAMTAKTEAKPAAAATASDACEKAVACCEIINPEGSRNAGVCKSLRNLPEASCTQSLKGFRRAVKVKAPKKLSACQ